MGPLSWAFLITANRGEALLTCKKPVYRVQIDPGWQTGGAFSCPEFPGCVREGLSVLLLILHDLSICMFCRAQSFVSFPSLGGKSSMSSGEG